jgi:protein gp37
MGVNKLTKNSNMYDWVQMTWNPVRGKCIHDCSYCSIKSISKRFDKPQEPIHLVESELKTNLGEGKTIFVGSSCDLFAKDVPSEWISKVLRHCKNFDGNKYLFQTKDPSRFPDFTGEYPTNTFYGTTIETNRENDLANAPTRESRADWMRECRSKHKIVTIEPIMKFDLEKFVIMIRKINPEWVNIGCDSKGNGLEEPSRAEVDALIVELKKFTEIKKKINLERLQ